MGKFKFIDLCAGIGGFHQAMINLGGKCVFAAEIDKDAIDTYKTNYNIDANHDICKLDAQNIPKYDVLCAGFPCQSFSKAGKRLGFLDKTKGTLFFEIARIIKDTTPNYIILENVKNLLTHDEGNTLKVIKDTLKNLNYNIEVVTLSPHQLGIPQYRERVYILGIQTKIYNKDLKITIPQKNKNEINGYTSNILSKNVSKKYELTPHEIEVLTCWDEFYQGINKKIIGFPIWASEFKSKKDLSELPYWKQNICIKNRQLYKENKIFINQWLKKWNNLNDFTATERKFEWQAGTSISSIWDAFVQFRPSGIRVKRPDVFPTLVAIVQVPIIAKYKRRLTPREAARLQSFPDTFIPNSNDHAAYKQFGNAVNVKCVEFLAKQLLQYK